MNKAKTEALEEILGRDYDNIAGMLVLKDGETVYEKYFNGCNAHSRIHVYSVTKSIVSLLIGIAIDKAYIENVHQKIFDFFPEYKPGKAGEKLQELSLENLLTMTAPYKFRVNPYPQYFSCDDWVKFSLDSLGGRGKLGQFQYAPVIGPDILSGILTRTTGQSVFDFAQENLFAALGITVEKNIRFGSKEEQLAFNRARDISGWAADSKGINSAGWGLTLSAADMAKIGQLCLNGGLWEGRQIVSANWISASTREQSRCKKPDLPYGYLWWICDDGYAAMGDGGNTIYVNTRKGLVVSIASLFKPKVRDRIELVQNHIEPLFEN